MRFQRPLRALSAFLLLLVPVPALAQLNDATLKGIVMDSDGNVVAASAVVARNTATGQVRSTATDEGGHFTIPSLPAGAYTVFVRVAGFKTYERRDLTLNVGQTTEIDIRLEVGNLEESVSVVAGETEAVVKTDARLSDTFSRGQIASLPIPQRDLFGLPKLSAGATFVPGAALSTKVTSSPVIVVNGNRYRGNNYVLDGALNVNPNNTGEPAIVPSVEAVDEVQVQTANFSSEFGRGNGAVVNMTTKSGGNEIHGRVWEYHRNAALNARNFFAPRRAPQTFNQFGANVGGPILRDRTFFFGSYEGMRNAVGQTLSFQTETPEFRDYVAATYPGSVAAQLLAHYPAPAPLPGAGGRRYEDQRDFTTPDGRVIPAVGRASVILDDFVRSDQYLVRVDHSFSGGKDKVVGRWIAEYQRDEGGTSNNQATLGKAIRGFRGPFDGFFGNANVGYVKVFDRAVNDLRLSFLTLNTTRGKGDALVPDVSIIGLTAPFGDVFASTTKLRNTEFRNTTSLERGAHTVRFGGEFRRIFKGISIGPPTSGAFLFTTLGDFARDNPFRQTLTVDPATGLPAGFPRFFAVREAGLFVQDDWKVSRRLTASLGLRYDYFGAASERDGRLSSVIFGEGSSFSERLANAAVGHVERLYEPEKLNLGPRLGLTLDAFGDGRTVVRAGFSLAFQPHHGQSIAGARALPPDAIQGVIQPSLNIGTRILYGIPVPFNAEFARGLNPQGGVISRPGEPPIRITGFVVNPDIKTQYSQNWFLNVQQGLPGGWVAELGYVGTRGVNLERIDDVNRFAGDLLDGREDRINKNFGVLLFVTNGVTSDYHAGTAELRREFSRGLFVRANYRWSKWLDTSSDTSTGQFQDNSEPGKGAQDASCLACERSRSLFDVPHRFSSSVVWEPRRVGDGLVGEITRNWQVSAIATLQSGRPFSVWNGASFAAGGDYNADGGGGAVGGGFYDRPDAPGTLPGSFDQRDFLTGLFDPSLFPKPAPGRGGTLGRNTFRGPRFATLDLSLARTFTLHGERSLQVRVEAFNALNTVNLYLPNTDLALALAPGGGLSKTSSFGKSTQAFEPRVIQASARFNF